MSREIKFRAWDIEKKKLLQEKDFEPKGINDIPENEIVFSSNRTWLMSIDEDDCMSEKKAIIEQFTGLRDRNGKEIYEGDIIKFAKVELPDGEGGYVSDEIIRQIEWGECIDGMYCESFYIGFDFPSIVAKYGNLDCEVIGNIHENPELLTERNL